jgi:hypothetical protein
MYESLLNLKRINIINKKASEVYKVKKAPYLEQYSKVALTGSTYSFETYFEPLKKYFSISVFSPKKGIFATSFEDITERKNYDIKQKEYSEELEKKIKLLKRFTDITVNRELKMIELKKELKKN